MKWYHGLIVFAIAIVIPRGANAQQENSDKDYTAYEYMSLYYNEGFNPFKKRNAYVGLSFSLDDKQQDNTTGLIQDVIDGNRIKYNIKLKGGYYISDYTMVGVNVEYESEKFVGEVFRDPDTVQDNFISRSFDVTPNIRPSIPLTRNERFSFFVQAGMTFGYTSVLSRDVKSLDVVSTVYTEGFHFNVGLSPGLTFFVMENFAVEVQLDLVGYDLQINNQTENNENDSRTVEQGVYANINLLTLNLGIAYNFGTKN